MHASNVNSPAIILFDGKCNLCANVVRFVLPRDTRGYFRFASLQSSAATRECAVLGFILESGTTPTTLSFAQFASDLDEATRKQLERGRLVTELMKQPQYEPLQVWEMALTLFAVNGGYFDDVDVKKALAAENLMRDYIQAKFGDLVKRIEDTKDLSKDDEEKLNAAIKDWKQNGSY